MDLQHELNELLMVAIAFSLLLFFVLISRFQNGPTIPGPSFFSQFSSTSSLGKILRNPRVFTKSLHEVYAKHGRVFAIWLGPVRTVVSANPADIVQIYANTKDFPRPPSFTKAFLLFSPRGMINMPRLQHDRARRVLRENFNHAMLSGFRAPMTNVVDELCKALDDATGPDGRMGRAVDFSQRISLTMFRILTLFAFGADMEVEERKKFSDNVDTLFEEVLLEMIGYPVRQYLEPFGVRVRLYKARSEIRSTLVRIVEKRAQETKAQQEARSPDLIDALLKVGDGDLSIAISMIVEFAFGGAHTTSQMLAWAMYELCTNEKVASRLAEEVNSVLEEKPLDEYATEEDLVKMPYLNSVWKETLRLHAANPGTMRVATRDVELVGSGTRIAKGTQIMAFSGATQVDGKIWKNPEAFRPERWRISGKDGEGDRVVAGAYVPFGIGSLSCAGRFLAEYEGKIALAECFRRFRFELGCRKDEVQVCSFFVDAARVASELGGPLDMGVPVRVERRHDA